MQTIRWIIYFLFIILVLLFVYTVSGYSLETFGGDLSNWAITCQNGANCLPYGIYNEQLNVAGGWNTFIASTILTHQKHFVQNETLAFDLWLNQIGGNSGAHRTRFNDEQGFLSIGQWGGNVLYAGNNVGYYNVNLTFVEEGINISIQKPNNTIVEYFYNTLNDGDWTFGIETITGYENNNFINITYDNFEVGCLMNFIENVGECQEGDYRVINFIEINNCEQILGEQIELPENQTEVCDYNGDGIIGELLGNYSYNITNNTINILNSINETVVEFEQNTSELLNLNVIEILEGVDNSYNYVIVYRLFISDKTIYLVKGVSNRVCIKDVESNVLSISTECNGIDETLISCPSNGIYNCEDLGTKYKISGLQHTQVKEYNYIELTQSTGGSSGGSGDGGGGGGSGSSSSSIQTTISTPPILELKYPLCRKHNECKEGERCMAKRGSFYKVCQKEKVKEIINNTQIQEQQIEEDKMKWYNKIWNFIKNIYKKIIKWF
jgi:uncharacterized membrane protein YgcG